MSDIVPGLREYCAALEDGDEAAISLRSRDFASRNWSFVTTIDRLAQADYVARRYISAASKFRLMEELLPHQIGFTLRRLYAAMRAGTPGAADELVAAAGRLTRDGELFQVVEELLANGRSDLAAVVIEQSQGREGLSPAMIAVTRARLYAAHGRISDAIALMRPDMAQPEPALLTMRCTYLMQEQLLSFQVAQAICARIALTWGEERELRHLVTRLVFIFDFDAATSLLGEFIARHPGKQELAHQLATMVENHRRPAHAALAEHGPVEAVDPAVIQEILSKPQVPPARVLWGKQALMALLHSGRMTNEDYERFAWYLPSWEEGRVRQEVLAAALNCLPYSPSVRRGWLHHLITSAAYGDAAFFGHELLETAGDADICFSILMLLRMQQLGVVPPFMDPERYEGLRVALLGRIADATVEFRCVMHDHIVALGGASDTWPAEAVLPHDHAQATALRRLFAVTTGRLSRVDSGAKVPAVPFLRPVIAISGQLRGFETAWDSLNTHLRAPTGAPVIVSVWDKSQNATGRHAKRLERALPADIVEQLKPEERYTDALEQAYPDTYRLLFGQTDVEPTSLRALVESSGARAIAVETESEDLIARLLPPYISSNMLKMYYKFARLEALIRAEESRTGELFSHVIWSRPDVQIQRLAATDLHACLARRDLAWSSYTTDNAFGDYVMVVPRQAFTTLAMIFPRVVTAGEALMLPWRPNRSFDPSRRSPLGAFGGPDVLFDTLLSAGYLPLARIPRMDLKLLGRRPPDNVVRAAFHAERKRAGDALEAG